jgi:hypothetical protein
MNFIFAADVVMSFFFAFYDEDFKIIDDPKKIAIKYCFTWFAFDLISILPLDLFSS